jgi:phage terminase small subunit
MESELSPRQRRFVAAMLTARTVREAAEAVGVTERTGLKYLANPTVKRALSHGLDQAMGQATREVVKAMTGALDTLREVHEDPESPTGARVSAARAILDAGPKLREALELAERVAALEQSLVAGASE